MVGCGGGGVAEPAVWVPCVGTPAVGVQTLSLWCQTRHCGKGACCEVRPGLAGVAALSASVRPRGPETSTLGLVTHFGRKQP